MFCDKCGKELAPGSIFCPNCGAKQHLYRLSEKPRLHSRQTSSQQSALHPRNMSQMNPYIARLFVTMQIII